jgi:mono/diheme cytochrome c family protein
MLTRSLYTYPMRRLVFGSMLLIIGLPQMPPRLSPEQVASLPAPADRPIDFVRDIKPILQGSCVKCHGRGRAKGGFSLETREAMLAGGDNGPAVTPGASQASHLIALVAGLDPDLVMPQKGSRLKPDQIGLLRAWIDQGATWDASVNFAKSELRNIDPRQPTLPAPVSGSSGNEALTNPIDRLLDPYFKKNGITPGTLIDDRQFARRVYLDAIGLLPSPHELHTFLGDRRPDKRDRLVQQLLADRRRYAEHWLSFWNDALRNDYRGPGGRQQISAWLYTALVENLPYNRFVSQLINPVPGAEGFTKGIVWRGVVNASQTPAMQAAQNISQVFMGVNLKCASCHDSFINDWQLADAYGLAGIYADAPLEMVECDRPTGRTAQLKFLYAKLGSIDAKAARAIRLQQLADVMTRPRNGRLSRTIVNRLWARFMGRGLVESLDDMEQPAWNPDLLDWLAEDLVAHGYDLKNTITRILTSRAYQTAAVDLPDNVQSPFRGPAIRRMSAEQFADAVSMVTDVWQGLPAGDFDFTAALDRPIPPLRGAWIWRASGGAATTTAGRTVRVAATPASVTPDDGAVLFRKSFHVPAVPFSALALVAYDGPFDLYINGQRAGEGKGKAGPNLIDIRSVLRPGQNLLALAARRAQSLTDAPASGAAAVSSDAPKPPASLLVELLARRGSRADVPIDVMMWSDDTWRWASDKSVDVTTAGAASSATSTGTPAWAQPGFVDHYWKPAVVRDRVETGSPSSARALARAVATASLAGRARAALVTADPLATALGRPNREQVVTARATAATTLQALELANGATLTRMLRQGAERLVADRPASAVLIARLYRRAFGRDPSAVEARDCRDLLGPVVRPEGVQDLLWAIVMLPEFQLIY